ncbi:MULTISPECIES: LCP family glycopolymer transferase [Shouchella]|uniref:Transcriptional regulator lytR n=3 Tax=Bacillaceae TaxID=186817 RepID=A0A060M6N2_9BACI|nr:MULTISPECIES: LCP family protein [Bacillaceae]AIC96228.1 Transcriptional regulator lytR [Shouchella lehensis G1]KQL58792.1 trascriptional regulator [Alkalicoccobacillus plakortidis]MBG9785120.1 trascriptional regulator [Shouchella lehensis]TES46554.1 LytR family transcriptional regulator [Shouchella lehensis]
MKKKTALKVTALIFGILFLVVIGVGLYIFNDIRTTANQMYEPLGDRQGSSPIRENEIQEGEPISILLAGVDHTPGREEDVVGRSDSIIVMTLNPAERSTKMLSIPRDTRVDIVGRGTTEKINHAHAYGGAEMLINTIEEAFNIPIDHYAGINMEGFTRLIDAFNGVEVYNDLSFTMDGSQFPEGTIALNGEEALKYTRMRYDDPRGDAGRANRQRDVIEALMNEAASLSSITKAGDILDVLGSTVRTDLALGDMWSYQSDYIDALDQVEQIEVNYTGQTIDGLWYAIVSEEEKARVRDEMRSHLDL